MKSAAIRQNSPTDRHIHTHRILGSRIKKLDQTQTPLVSAIQECATRQNAAFYTPGHKRGDGISQRHFDLWGKQVFRADLPELPELDNLFAPEGAIARAQTLAAEAFGTDYTYFLANGSTCGIEAAILATCRPGDKIIVPRNLHRSVVSGLILSGAMPIYLNPPVHPDWSIPAGLAASQVEEALRSHPETTAVLAVSPTYHGLCANLQALSTVTHQYNIPLIVDAAHGAHFTFHPDLPESAIASGADIVIESAHKTLSAFTQAGFLHIKGDRISPQRIAQALQLTQSTSPSYLLLGSLDAARHQMATEGRALLSRTIQLADRAADTLRQISELRVLQPKCSPSASREQGIYIEGDRTRLTVDVSALGITGFDADDYLHTHYSVTAELPGLSSLTFIVSIGNCEQDIGGLISAFQDMCTQNPIGNAQSIANIDSIDSAPSSTQLAYSPRDVFFAKHQPIRLEQAVGQVSAETICPYPPGIPLLLPGEVITERAIAQLRSTLTAGGIVTGGTDPTYQTLLIVTQTAKPMAI